MRIKQVLLATALFCASAFVHALPAHDVAFEQVDSVIHVEQADVNLDFDNPVEFALAEFEFRRDINAGREQTQTYEKTFAESLQAALVKQTDAAFEVGWRSSPTYKF